MLDDNGIFTINSGFSHNKLEEVHKQILESVKNIKVIEVSQDEVLQSSALLSLLKTIKQSEPDIQIPLIDKKNSVLLGLGNFAIMDNNKNDV